MKKIILHTGEWKHRKAGKIDLYGSVSGFPSIENFGINKEEFEDYIDDKQDILDRVEERKNNYLVKGGFLIVPILAVSVFLKNEVQSLLIGVLIGVVLLSLYLSVSYFMDKRRLKNIYNEKIERYIDAVLEWSQL